MLREKGEKEIFCVPGCNNSIKLFLRPPQADHLSVLYSATSVAACPELVEGSHSCTPGNSIHQDCCFFAHARAIIFLSAII